MRMSGITMALPVVGSAIALALSPNAAHAQYLDPGAGSIIVQAVIAATIGAAAVVKLYGSRISAFISQRRSKDTGRN